MNVSIATALVAARPEPVISAVGENTWDVTLGQQRGRLLRTLKSTQVYSGKRYAYYVYTFVVIGNDGTEHTWTFPEASERARTEAHCTAHVLAYFAAVKDALVWFDTEQARGIEGVFASLSKKQDKAVAAALTALNNGVGLLALEGGGNGEGCFALVIPGVAIRFFGTERNYGRTIEARTFALGDRCVRDSYNVAYFGKVAKITDRFIYASGGSDPTKRHTFDSFRQYNKRTIAEVEKTNHEWMD